MANQLIHQNTTLVQDDVKDWTINLERLRVSDAQEESFFSDGDEPYFVVIGFRSKFDTLNSTQVFLNSFRDDDWADGVDDGDERNIPNSMGTVAFNNVRSLNAADILAGEQPEIVGAITIAIESDATPWSTIQNLVNGVRDTVDAQLTKLVEEGGLNLINPGPDIRDAISDIKSSIEFSFWEKVKIALSSFGDPDDVIDLHSFFFPAVDPALAGSFTPPSSPNLTVKALDEQSYNIGSNPVVYSGNGATYQVTTTVKSTPARAAIAGLSESGDWLGEAVVAGNFDGSDTDDLAIGVPFEDVGSITNSGAVNVVYGSKSGLSGSNNQIWHQNSGGVQGAAESHDRFGTSLATGDFDGDGRDDLAVGVTGEDIGSTTDAGAVNVLYSSSTGLTATNNQVWHQNSTGVQYSSQAFDRFGASLATGDFDGDGRDDLAVGVTGEDIGIISNAGVVNVLYGSSTGLTATNNQVWHQNSAGVADSAEAGDQFGSALASGDFDGDGRDDLAIGAQFEDVGSKTAAGSVNVLYGSSAGLSSTGNQVWHQDSAGVRYTAEEYDYFGATLGVGDFNGDGKDDLAAGSIGEDVGSIKNAGVVNVLYGSNSGLTATNNQVWHQNSAGIAGTAEAYDRFGSSLAVGDFDGDGYDDLAIAVDSEDIGSTTNAGAVNVIYGSSSGLTSAGNQIWHQDSFGIQGIAEAFDSFGSSLTAGDFNGDGRDDLAIGVSGEDIGSIANAGTTNILFGSSAGLTA